jgi:2-polyprenyl-6-methoxyphenol hydroxylase-like FAD-dependent oxidoreductase
MFARTSPTVIVAGGGPVGLLGALCLHDQHVPLEVIDAAPRDVALRRRYWLNNTHLLHPRSIALLDRYGVAATVLARARRVRTLGVYSGAERLATLSFERVAERQRLPFPFAAVISHADLDDCLREALRQRRIVVHDQQRVARIEQGSARIRVTIDHLESDSAGYATARSELMVSRSEELEPELVIAADGTQSVAREQLDLGFRELRPVERFAIFDGQARAPLSEDAALVLGADESLGVWPLPSGRYHVITSTRQRDADGRAAASGEPLARAPWLETHFGALEPRSLQNFEHGVASAWGRGRVWLAGTAAHCTSPLASQDLNAGLSESARLGELFAMILRGEASLGTLASYEQERARDWQRLLGLAPPLGTSRGALGMLDMQRLAPCIPACGEDFDVLLEQVQSGAARDARTAPS